MKNLEIKTEQMSLATLKNNLSLAEMENIVGGQASRDNETANIMKHFFSGCGGAMVGGAIAYAGFFVVGTSVIGAGVAAAGFIYTSAQIGATCGYR